MTRLLFFLPYVLVGGAYIRAAWRKDGRPQALMKPFLMPLLLLGRLLAAGWEPLICGGLILGFLGDVLLMKPGQAGFVAGLAAFLAGHVCYVVYAARALLPVFAPASLIWCLPVAAYAVLLYRRLYPHLGSMRLPVLAYCAVLACMASAGGAWFFSAPSPASGLFALGGVLFTLSDSFLAVGLFDRPAPRQDFIVMSTYILAQMFIAVSSVV